MFLAAAAICLAGCDGAGPQTYPVKGEVRYQNEPVAGAEVSLLPLSDSASARPARGVTAADGSFTVKTYVAPGNEPAGAMPGDYVVTVQKIETPAGIVDPYDRGAQLPKNLLPAKYSSPAESPLKTTVTPQGSDRLLLELTD